MTIVTGPFVGPDRGTADLVTFHRTELTLILQTYGRMLVAGVARDYAINHLRDAAIFCIFRRHAEHPIYRIEKRPKLTEKHGLWSVVGMDGHILKRGNDLSLVLKALDRKLIRVVSGD